MFDPADIPISFGSHPFDLVLDEDDARWYRELVQQSLASIIEMRAERDRYKARLDDAIDQNRVLAQENAQLRSER